MRPLLVVSLALCAVLPLQLAAVLPEKTEETQPELKAAVPETPENAAVSRQVHYNNSCPGGWHSFQGSCYLLVNNQLTWSGAEASCASRQASLASAHSLLEYNFLQKLARTTSQSYAWLGGFYFQGKWRWEDSSDYNYETWFSQSSVSAYPCLYLNTYESRGWSNGNCASTIPSICARRNTFC